MKMYETGRLCVKIAGRDARQKCVIIEVLDDNFVMIDGQTRRRKCNIKHLEPLDKVLKLKKGASHSDVVSALKSEGIEVTERKTKTKKERIVKKRKAAGEIAEKTTEEPAKKEEPKAVKPAKETKKKAELKEKKKK
ncbi:TPA: 50S ribosomal protein L14e [Candidatus Woesearchaeota archaeon]|nr:50S ribosomal protein L14e [Candidatus Woesearchaeota archaeon]HIH41349.1 50S ribosomal protein L14e [Candidatus Woesearchaeota archaeon]